MSKLNWLAWVINDWQAVWGWPLKVNVVIVSLQRLGLPASQSVPTDAEQLFEQVAQGTPGM
jgi:hypothetical protein